MASFATDSAEVMTMEQHFADMKITTPCPWQISMSQQDNSNMPVIEGLAKFTDYSNQKVGSYVLLHGPLLNANLDLETILLPRPSSGNPQQNLRSHSDIVRTHAPRSTSNPPPHERHLQHRLLFHTCLYRARPSWIQRHQKLQSLSELPPHMQGHQLRSHTTSLWSNLLCSPDWPSLHCLPPQHRYLSPISPKATYHMPHALHSTINLQAVDGS